ncbi:MAG: hypothetical protein EPN36_02710 [Rhodanobacteraceae bacterium]|nr:MAG: hypothetical protein EPN36_02710 [Rhodanobacteraceae bacterium]
MSDSEELSSASFRTSRSDNPGPSLFRFIQKAETLDYSPHPRLALRAIGCADVRYGIPAFAVPLARE